MSGKDVTFVAQMKKSPVITVTAEVDIPPAATVSAIRSAIRHILGTAHVGRTPSSASGTATDLHIIYEIRLRHKYYLFSASITSNISASICSLEPFHVKT